MQEEIYTEELRCIRNSEDIQNISSLHTLNPVIDEVGLIRVGGHISLANIEYDENYPIKPPARHHIATLIVRHYHEQSQHQGRHLTEGAIRSARFWLIGPKRCICSFIFKCVTCKRDTWMM